MLNIRPATPADVPTMLRFIHELAIYEREPNAVIATETDLLECRDVRQLGPALVALDGKRAQLAGLDVRQQHRLRGGVHLDLAGQHIGERRRRAFVRHEHDVRPAFDADVFEQEVRRDADAAT